jgi:cyclic pyranopterin phosphate synthase
MALTHFNEYGRARMVEVSDKEDSVRIAEAKSFVRMNEETVKAIGGNNIKKGDVFSVAQVAGIMGAKKTSDFIPMCHPLMLSGVDLDFQLKEDGVEITATVKTIGKTGVEMEALSAVSIAGLTIYDMCKAIDKEMILENTRLVKKQGGKSGDFYRGE